jgi:mono/diheme cytochrome c family protein
MTTRAIVILSAALVAGCTGEAVPEGSGDRELIAATPSSTLQLSSQQEHGAEIFRTLCWTCHGASGRGDGPVVLAGSVPAPPDFHAGEYPLLSLDQFEARFEAALSGSGDPHAHMPYTASILRPDAFREALSFIPVLNYPTEIPGSALAGGEIYQFRCQGCHGPTGRGDGLAGGSLVDITPADFTADTLIAQRDWDGLFGKIRGGGEGTHTAMPPWGMLFSDDEMWDLVAYIASLQPGVFPTLAEETGGP